MRKPDKRQKGLFPGPATGLKKQKSGLGRLKHAWARDEEELLSALAPLKSSLDAFGEETEEILAGLATPRSEEHTSELQSRPHLVCRLLLEKKKKQKQKS